MTREEAIQYIDGLRCKEDFPYTDTIADFIKERNEAIDMAIEALSAEAVQGVGRYENAMQKLRELPRYINGVKERQIEKMPTKADTAEVVRCIDCKHYKPLDKSKKFDCPQGLYAVFENDYCSHGERSEE